MGTPVDLELRECGIAREGYALGFRVSGFGFRVSGFGFRFGVSGLGCSVACLERHRV